MLAGFRKVRAAADSDQHVIPGHDPQVLARYPKLPGDAVGIACLHLAPLIAVQPVAAVRKAV
jgi:hypothetical protein